MAVTVKQGDTIQTYINEYQCDTLEALQELGTDPYVRAGSTCLVLENSSVWAFGEDGIWHEL